MINRKNYLAIAGILTLSIIVLVPLTLAATSGTDIPTLIKDLEQKLWSGPNSVKNDTKRIASMDSKLNTINGNIGSVNITVKSINASLSSQLDDINGNVGSVIKTLYVVNDTVYSTLFTLKMHAQDVAESLGGIGMAVNSVNGTLNVMNETVNSIQSTLNNGVDGSGWLHTTNAGHVRYVVDYGHDDLSA